MTTPCRRSFFLLATCFLLTLLVVALQARPVAARGQPAAERQEGGEDYLVFLPLISNIPHNTISGQVTLAGEAAPGYVLHLMHYNGADWDLVQETTTNADGRYKFANVPPTDRIYVVSYDNTEPNGFDERCLSFWDSPWIYSSTAYNINFDIANVFMDKVSGAQPFPVAFRWYPRSTPFETYQFFLYGPDFTPNYFFYDSGVFEYTLYDLPYGFQYNAPYEWGVTVRDQSGGSGLSLVYEIIFDEQGSAPKGFSQFQSSGNKSPAALHREMLTPP